MKNGILTINAGSSSLKFKIFELENDGSFKLLSQGQVSGIDVGPKFKAKDADGETIKEFTWGEDGVRNHSLVLRWLLEWIKETYTDLKIVSAGHRVVHGGTIFKEPILVNDEVIAKMESLINLAPLHQEHNIRPIKILKEIDSSLAQVAVFDTAFHQTMTGNATYYAIPYSMYRDEGIRRYGMHGISYEYIAHKLKEVAPDIASKKVIVAHIGSGASVTALKDGKSVMTSMGFTALDGVPMGTRPGSIDSGILLYLLKQKGYDANRLEQFLYYECGAGGLSELSSDFYVLETSKEESAARAFDFMAFKVAQEISSLAVPIGGVDAIVFTAGVGENSDKFRSLVCNYLSWLGLEVNETANSTRGHMLISTDASKVKIFAIPTDEELMIAAHTKRLTR